MKLWVDDVRPCPSDNYELAKSVFSAEAMIVNREVIGDPYEMLDLDHDAGDYSKRGGDYIKLLDWLEATKRNYPIRIHSMNPVGVQNMRAIIQKNGWVEVVGMQQTPRLQQTERTVNGNYISFTQYGIGNVQIANIDNLVIEDK